MLTTNDITHLERGLLIGGNPKVLREVLEEIRKAYSEAAMDMGKILGDVVLSLETKLEEVEGNEDRTFLVRAYHTEEDFQNAKATMLAIDLTCEREAVQVAKDALTQRGCYVRSKVLSSDDEVCRVFTKEIIVKEVP